MRPFIYFDQKRDVPFEGIRLRKNLKGALELNNIEYVTSFLASPDIFHTICSLKDNQIFDCRSNDVKIVASPFFAPHDYDAKFLEKDKDGFILTRLGALTLMGSDLIIVPSEEAKEYLSSLGAKAPIEIMTPGINLTRFQLVDELEKNVFSRYARISTNEKYFISSGDYQDFEGLKRLGHLAKANSKIRFFFVGSNSKGKLSPRDSKRLSKQYGQNITFLYLLNDDLYRSALSGASGYLSLGDLPNHMATLEAMSAKIPVYEWRNLRFGNLSIDGQTGFVFENIDKLNETFTKECQKPSNATIIEAYEFAKKNSLKNLGEKLMLTYEKVLNPLGGNKQ